MASVHHISVLLNFYKLWMIGPNLVLESGNSVDVVYLDLHKALTVCLTDDYWLIHMVYL